eukprot:scaffold3571_cov176-Amphora_coffeaeformis.AAC.27
MSHELHQNHPSTGVVVAITTTTTTPAPSMHRAQTRAMENENAFRIISILFQDDEKEAKADVYKAHTDEGFVRARLFLF